MHYIHPFYALGAFVTPALQVLVSRRASDDQKGKLHSLVLLAKSMTMIFSISHGAHPLRLHNKHKSIFFLGTSFVISTKKLSIF